MTQQGKNAEDEVRKARSVSSTAAEWNEISARAKASGQSISAYAIGKAMNPSAGLFSKGGPIVESGATKKRFAPALTAKEQRQIYNRLMHLTRTDQDIVNLKGYGSFTATECIEAMFMTLAAFLEANNKIPIFEDIIEEVRDPTRKGAGFSPDVPPV